MGSERSTATKAESTSPTWEHPRAELREELQRRPAAWVAALRGASRDPLLVARIPAVYRKLTAAGVPHVLPLLAIERDGDRLLLVHRHESGESLAHRLARGRLPVARTLTILRAICRSLAAAHRAGVEHRALGPSSVLLGAHDDVWLIDFAVADLFDALAEDAEVDAPDVALHPMTPERARGEDGSAAEDVYLVGCLAYWMIAGVPPFAAVDLDELAQRHASARPRPLTELAGEPVPFTLIDVVARALAKDPDERFADLDELDRALAQAQLEAGASRPREQPRMRTLPPRTTHPFGTDPPRPMPRELAIKLERLAPTMMIEPQDRAHMPAVPQRIEHEENTAPLPVAKRGLSRTHGVAILLGVAAALVILLAPLRHLEPEEVRWSGLVREEPIDGGARARPIVPEQRAAPTRAAEVVPTPPPAPAIEASEPAGASVEAKSASVEAKSASASVEAKSASVEARSAGVEAKSASAGVEATGVGAPKRAAMPRDAQPAAKAAPAHESAECQRARELADTAREVHDWSALLQATSRGACWANREDALTLRVKAMMELRQFAECASAVDRIASPRRELARMGELCRRRAAPG